MNDVTCTYCNQPSEPGWKINDETVCEGCHDETQDANRAGEAHDEHYGWTAQEQYTAATGRY